MVEKNLTLKLTYDPEANAAYIYLVKDIKNADVASTVTTEDPSGNPGNINLDFDVDGRILGIEILDASKVLDPTFLQ